MALGTATHSPLVLATDYEAQIAAKEAAISTLTAEQEAAKAQVSAIQSQVTALQKEKAKLEEENQRLSAESERLTTEIKDLSDKIIARTESLENQARSAQQNSGATNYISAILDADSISDAISRIAAIREVISANESMLKQQEEDKAYLDKVKEGYQKAIDDKNAAYKKYLDEVKARCNTLNEEIINLEKQKVEESTKLETYEKEKNESFDKLERDALSYVEGVRDTLRQINEQKIQITKIHDERIVSIKTLIANIMYEYDYLLESKPHLIEDANSEKVDLTGKAKKFAESIKTLEKAHYEIMAELENKRQETIENIKKEIMNLEKGKSAKLKTYSDQITDISLAYDALLRDEKAKQANLSSQIVEQGKQKNEILINAKNQLILTEEEYEQGKQALATRYQQSMKESTEDFTKSSNELKEEFTSLASKHRSITKDLSELTKRFTTLDNEINRAKNELQNKCNDQLQNVGEKINEVQKANKKKLDSIDMLG